MELSKEQLLVLQLISKGKLTPDIEKYESNQVDGYWCRFVIKRDEYDKHLSKTFGVEKDSSNLHDILEELLKLKLLKVFEHDDFLLISQEGKAYVDSMGRAKRNAKWNIIVHIITFAIAIAGLVVAIVK